MNGLVEGLIDRVYVIGGQEIDGVPLSHCYLDYLTRRLRTFDNLADRVTALPGGVETGSDLREAAKYLHKVGELTVYTSSYHGKRAVTILDHLGYQANFTPTEALVRGRSTHHPRVVDAIFDENFLTQMNSREQKIAMLMAVDSMPLVGQYLLGMKLIEFLARQSR